VALLTRPSAYLHYNAGAFFSGGEACLVDPGITPDEIAGLAAEVGDARLRFVVLTHADWDHVLGRSTFRRRRSSRTPRTPPVSTATASAPRSRGWRPRRDHAQTAFEPRSRT
jgi:glyoxylase-like metal-dependent hydrolase (beta-lactamase superfamily II)